MNTPYQSSCLTKSCVYIVYAKGRFKWGPRGSVQQNGAILSIKRCKLDQKFLNEGPRPTKDKTKCLLYDIILKGNTNDPDQEMKLKEELIVWRTIRKIGSCSRVQFASNCFNVVPIYVLGPWTPHLQQPLVLLCVLVLSCWKTKVHTPKTNTAPKTNTHYVPYPYIWVLQMYEHGLMMNTSTRSLV